MAAYGSLADGTVPVVGMGVSIEDTSGSEVALGRIAYLDKSDEEIRVEFLEEFAEAVGEKGFKYAVRYQRNIWVLGKFLRKVDEGIFIDRKAASEAKARAQEEYDHSPEFLAKLEAGTSDLEPAWPGGSWSAKAAEDSFGLRQGMRFTYLGTPPSLGGLTHGKVLEIKDVRLGDPFYVWPNYAGPIAVCVDWTIAKTYIARPTGKLAGKFGETVRAFMAEYKYIPVLQRIVTLRSEPAGSNVKVVGANMSGDAIAELLADPSWSIEEFEPKLLALDALKPSDDSEQVVIVLPDGRLVRDLPQDMTVGDVLAA